MTTEEKAKAYDEAIERAKSKLHYPAKPCFVDVTEIFPELVESEEERIRKELIAVIDDLVLPNEQKERFNDYLENQGEQQYWKPSEEQLQTLHAQLNEGAVTYPEDKRILFTLYKDLMKIMTQEEKQAEQKPAWSEEDERLRDSCIAHIEEELERIRNDKYGHSEIISDLKESCRERIKWLESLNKN